MTILPKGKQWIGHCGNQARLRYLRQICRPVISSTDPEVITVLQKIKERVTEGPFQEYGILMIIFQIKEVVDSTGIDFVEAAYLIIDKLKENADVTTEIPTDDGGSDRRDS